jgi:transcriptional regulator with XRE-family HTH domain
MSQVMSTTRCDECGGVMEGRKGEYKYTECGLQSVKLVDILVYHCPKCNAIVPEIPAAGVLHRVIALKIVNKKNLLTGSEIRFLRKLCGYSVEDFAEIMGSSKNVIHRFERDGCGKENDRTIRLLVLAKLSRELLGQPDKILRNVTIEQLLSDLLETFKIMEGRAKKDQQYEIPPEEISRYIGSTEDYSEPKLAAIH